VQHFKVILLPFISYGTVYKSSLKLRDSYFYNVQLRKLL